MQMSARGAQKKRDESKKLVMYSKQWLPGDTLRVFYPIYWEDGHPEIAVGAIWGHSVSDIKALGLHTAFIPSTTDFNEDRMPIGQPDVTWQFSRIARAFVDGMKEAELQKAESKPWPDKASKKAALKDIEEKYDTKSNPSAVRPIIGPVQYYISTECVSIKIANDAPVIETLTLSSAPLSGSTISKLYTILEDPKYMPEEGSEFFEVEWKYVMDTNKGASSRNSMPTGLTKEYRFESLYPDRIDSVKQLQKSVSFDSASIRRRATRSVDPAKVLQAIKRYALFNSEYLDLADTESQDRLVNNIEILDKIGIIPSLKNETLVDKINEALQKYKEDRQQEVSDIIPNPDNAKTDMPENLASDVDLSMAALDSNAPTINDLLNNENVADSDDTISDSLLEDIDLSSLS